MSNLVTKLRRRRLISRRFQAKRRYLRPLAAAVAAAAGGAVLAAAVTAQAPGAPKKQDPNDWNIPDAALSEKNPLEPTTAVLAAGEKIYKAQCERCHGADGKGGGPDADRDNPPGDLTSAKRARMNPDGVVFWKIWNGRKAPEMPAAKADLTKEQVWQVVHYTRTLRGAPKTP